MNSSTTAISVVACVVLMVVAAVFSFSRSAYESAQYAVVKTDGNIELRDYPELVLATTGTDPALEGRDGSFMRLFGYISGENVAEQKIAMTTPVFMDETEANSEVRMGFVVPADVIDSGVPDPTRNEVVIRKREAGKFAVLSFSGQLSAKRVQEQAEKLRDWLEKEDLSAEVGFEAAGYDPPWTPGFLRRNEVLIRLKDSADAPQIGGEKE